MKQVPLTGWGTEVDQVTRNWQSLGADPHSWLWNPCLALHLPQAAQALLAPGKPQCRRPTLVIPPLCWWLLFLCHDMGYTAFSCEPPDSKDYVLCISTSPLPTVLGTLWVPNAYFLNKNKHAGEWSVTCRTLAECLPVPTHLWPSISQTYLGLTWSKKPRPPSPSALAWSIHLPHPRLWACSPLT